MCAFFNEKSVRVLPCIIPDCVCFPHFHFQDLSVAQRRAERKVVRERRVYHLPDSDSVNIDEVFNMLEDAGEIGGKKVQKTYVKTFL